ncbi:MAG: HD domain-containing protein [Thermaceae bacterium]
MLRPIRALHPPFYIPKGALLVGGAVRDLLLGRRPLDLDFLAEDPEGIAQKTAQELGGRAFPLSEERGQYRVAVQGMTLDFAPLPKRLEEDLLGRDFRINALVLVKGIALGLPKVEEDLEKRRLEPVREENLYQDSLRSLRGVRLSVTLGLGLGKEARAALARHAVHLLAHPEEKPAPERVESELTRILLSPRAAYGVWLMERLGLLEVYLEELAETRGIDRLGRHFLDVFHHSLSVLFHLTWLYPKAPLELRLAALLHDVGKAKTQAWDEGKKRYRRESAKLAEALLLRLRFPKRTVKRVTTLILAHMHPLPQTPRLERRFFLRYKDLLPDLLYLQAADRFGRKEGEAEGWAFLELAKRFLQEPPPRKPLLSGEEVMALLSLHPGPEVGRVLNGLLLAQAEGRVKNREDALAFLEKLK